MNPEAEGFQTECANAGCDTHLDDIDRIVNLIGTIWICPGCFHGPEQKELRTPGTQSSLFDFEREQRAGE